MTNKRLIFSLALLALLFVSCGKQEEGRTNEGFEPHPTWTDDSTNDFWEKGLGDGIIHETSREEEATKYL